MPEMKDSGVNWMGDIPSHWKKLHLKHLCTFKTGGTPPGNIGINTEKEGYQWVTASDMNDTLKIKNSTKYITSDIVKQCKYQLFPPNSILLVCIASVGKMGLIDKHSYSNQQITALKPNDKIIPTFLLYQIKAMENNIIADAHSNVVPIINTTYLSSIKCLLPPIYEQQKIADYLDKKCSEIDSLFADIQSQIDVLEEYKKSVITEAVTKGLHPDVEMKDSGIEWIGKIPAHWDLIRIKNTSWLKGRIGWQGLRSDEFIDNGPYLITGTDFHDGYINWDTCVHISEQRFMEDILLHIHEGDLLITKDGTIGKVAIVKNCPEKASLNSGVMIIRNKGNYKYFDKYMYYLLLSEQFTKWFNLTDTGNSTIKHLTQDKFYKFKFTYPTMEEQIEIAQHLDAKCTEIDAAISDKKAQLETLAEYKKSLIYEYVTGKKEVPVV